MNTEKEEILKNYFKNEFEEATPPDDLEDKIMDGLQQKKSFKPLVSLPVRIAAIVIAILIPVISLIAVTGKDLSAVGPDIDVSPYAEFFTNTPIVPILGIILTYMAIDVLLRRRKNAGEL